MSPRVADIASALERAFPAEWAEPWDRIGLLAGEPDREVTGVVLALDPTPSVIRRAASLGANVVVTHHPAFIDPPQAITPGPGPAGVLFAALEGGMALVNAHTNLDRAPAASGLIPALLGMTVVGPVERSMQPMTLVTTFVPSAHADNVVDAMTSAGAGRIGQYERAFFGVSGQGRFTPGAEARPFTGRPGERTETTEDRIEMVCPPNAARAVASAARASHPYDEPLIVTAEIAIARSAARLGSICEVTEPATLGEMAARAAARFGAPARVWGDPSRGLARVATATGSASSLIADVRSRDCDALVAGEVRYHDALDAVESGLAIVELGHDVSEWPLVDLLEQVVSKIAGLEPSTIHREQSRPAWWTPREDL